MKRYDIENRRYIGNKKKLLDWIFNNILNEVKGSSFCDIFSGTGVVAEKALKLYDKIIINDFLYSNNIIYNAFFNSNDYDEMKLIEIIKEFNNININEINDNYFNINFGNKYFGNNDAKKIGYIREQIEELSSNDKITNDEKNILISSLIYSLDKIANTVGHYEAYRKIIMKDNLFEMGIINVIEHNTTIEIYREDANILSNVINADIVFIDPPYNSRQYSRFYHLLETLVKWDNPELFGTALKPREENMSDYCRNTAPIVFENLIKSLKCKYVVVTYNNTYNSKSSSSKNKISYDEIYSILNDVGKTKVFEKEYKFFNAGKTDFKDHKEFLFITEVKNGK